VSVRINRKENLKVLVENWFVRFIQHKMHFLHAKLFMKHSGNMYRYLCFVPDLIQVIINIVMLGYIPNIHMELSKAFL
jgi:hypothetical protein